MSAARDPTEPGEPPVQVASAAEATSSGNPLCGRDMLCFSHDFTGDPLSKTHLMRLFARDNRVLWVNSIGYRMPSASSSDLRRIVNKLKAFAEPVKIALTLPRELKSS